MFALIVILGIFSVWWNYRSNNLKVEEDPTSQTDLAAAKEAAQPLLDALEKYHAANGLYPASLGDLEDANAPSHHGRHDYLYSGTWVFKSDPCKAREKELHGWIMKPNNEYQKRINDFKSDCVAGYRDYQLQSGDFPPDANAQHRIERWAHFDSQTKQWTLGWCAVVGKHNQQMATNGVCRWGNHGADVVW